MLDIIFGMQVFFVSSFGYADTCKNLAPAMLAAVETAVDGAREDKKFLAY